MKARLTTPLLALLVGGLVAAGCGSSEPEDAGDPGPAENPQSEAERNPQSGGNAPGKQTLQNPADPSGKLAFQKKEMKAKAGEVTLVMKNPSSIPHAIAIRHNGADASGDTVQKGGTSRISVELKKGEYEFYCPVPGHEPGGMVGKLTVE